MDGILKALPGREPGPDLVSDAVISRGADERFSLTEAQEDELLAAMAEIERGEFVTLEELLQSLPKRG